MTSLYYLEVAADQLPLYHTWVCHLVVVKLVCLSDPNSDVSGTCEPSKATVIGLVKGEMPDKGQSLAIHVGGIGVDSQTKIKKVESSSTFCSEIFLLFQGCANDFR